MSTMWADLQNVLLPAVRVVGVALGVWGAVMVSPDAAREVASTVATNWLRLRARLGFPRNRTVQASGHAAAASVATGAGVAFDARVLVWPNDAAGQIEILRQRTDTLDDAVATLRTDHKEQIARVNDKIEGVRAAHRAAIAGLEARQQEQKRTDLKVNARGLPLIGASIVLSGLPDAVMGNPWVDIVALLLAAVVAVAVWRGPMPA